jgi:hypothetical protein
MGIMIMPQPSLCTSTVFIGIITLFFQPINLGLTLAADSKPDAARQSTTPKQKIGTQTFHTAETAAKGKACFGEAPQIAKLVPDEGKPGAKVSIHGAQFGTPNCLRGVSFGPGHAATFTMPNESMITTTVPTSSRKGLVILTVTTASGEDSKPFLVK